MKTARFPSSLFSSCSIFLSALVIDASCLVYKGFAKPFRLVLHPALHSHERPWGWARTGGDGGSGVTLGSASPCAPWLLMSLRWPASNSCLETELDRGSVRTFYPQSCGGVSLLPVLWLVTVVRDMGSELTRGLD